MAFGGGAVLGAAHIGVLKAIREFDIPVHCIAGTSIGAFVSAFYANGVGWETIQKIAMDLKWLDLSGISLSKRGLLSNEKMGKLVEKHLGKSNLEDAEIPVAMIATNIVNGEKVVLKKGNTADAVMASTCIPGIFTPMEINGRMLVDGGIVENVPISPLKEMGADIIIAVDLNSGNKHKEPENIIEVLLRTFDFLIKTSTELQTEKAHVLIEPDLSDFNMVDIGQAPDLIEKGYSEAVKVLKQRVKS
ncbi:MAG: patatin-like phospholipase family protein [Candidatus Marinimicrobia bacterium]|nr:patatin-like phospholipase family protein [Candidatus Neomarinimicrobiota bacterium]